MIRSIGTEKKMKVAVIGAGAAGLAATRIITRNGINSVTVFEKEDYLGGVWDYNDEFPPEEKKRPMYKGLRTNLPREVMAYREKPWGGDLSSPSFVTHKEVRAYLQQYSEDYNLHKYIRYGCEVQQLIVLSSEYSLIVDQDGSNLPKIKLHWSSTKSASHAEAPSSSQNEQLFDAVCICNGHFSTPSPPNIPNMHLFPGSTIHSVQYDDPSIFRDQVVLCIGARASGADLAREISAHASSVYVSDSTFPLSDSQEARPKQCGNVTWLPRTLSYDPQSGFHFANECPLYLSNVDVVIYCSGYDYNFPFINQRSNLELSVVPGEKRVSPLYQQVCVISSHLIFLYLKMTFLLYLHAFSSLSS